MNRLCALASGLLLLVMHPCFAGEEPADELVAGTGNTAQPGWTRLVYSAAGLPGKPTTSLEITASSMEDLDIPGIRYQGQSFTPFEARHVRLLTVTGQHEDDRTRLRIWFDAETGTVLQRDRLKPGPGGSRKIHRFGPEGAARVRLEPANRAQARATPSGWTNRKDKVFPYDLAGAGCSRVTVPTLVLYTVSSVQGDSTGNYLCVFQDDTLYRAGLESRGSEPVSVDYTIRTGSAQHQVAGEQTLEKIGLRIEAVSDGQDTAGFELLELRGEIAIYLDPASRLPVVISGDRSVYRNIHISLDAASLAE